MAALAPSAWAALRHPGAKADQETTTGIGAGAIRTPKALLGDFYEFIGTAQKYEDFLIYNDSTRILQGLYKETRVVWRPKVPMDS